MSRCFHCRQVGHKRAQCPQIMCYRCRGLGHLQFACPQRLDATKPVNTIKPVEAVETVEPVESVESVETVETVEAVEPAETVETVETVKPVEKKKVKPHQIRQPDDYGICDSPLQFRRYHKGWHGKVWFLRIDNESVGGMRWHKCGPYIGKKVRMDSDDDEYICMYDFDELYLWSLSDPRSYSTPDMQYECINI